MVKELTDKNDWAIILGGSSGLGLGSAKKLAEHGMNLILVHRDRRSEMQKITACFSALKNKGVEVISFNVDAANPLKRAETLEEIKKTLPPKAKIKSLIHSIAKGNLKAMTGKEPTLQHHDFQLTIDAMGISLYDWVKDVHSLGLFAEDARVISFTSAGNKKAWKGYAAVSAAKAVLEALTRNIALEFASHGIRANCVQAGTVNTASFRAIPGSEQLKEQSLKTNPFNRLTNAEDVANAVLLLISKEASWITGAVIPVDGGEHLS